MISVRGKFTCLGHMVELRNPSQGEATFIWHQTSKHINTSQHVQSHYDEQLVPETFKEMVHHVLTSCGNTAINHQLICNSTSEIHNSNVPSVSVDPFIFL